MDQDESTEPKKIEPISPDWVHESMDQPGEDEPFFEITDPVTDQPESLAEKVDFEQIDLGDGSELGTEQITEEPEFQDAIVDEMTDNEEGAPGEILDMVDEPVALEDLDHLAVADQGMSEPSEIDVASIYEEVRNLEPSGKKDNEDAIPTWLEATLDEPKPDQVDEITDKIKIYPSIEKVAVSEPPEETVTPVPALPLVPEEDIDIPVEEAYRSQHKAPERRFLGMTAVQRFFFFLLLLVLLVILGVLFLALSGKIAIPF